MMFRIEMVAAAVLLAILGSARGVRAQATAVTTTESVPFDLTVLIPCVPENVHLTGNLQIVNHTTVNADGGVHLVSHVNPQGLSGVGDVTGDKYQGSGLTQNVINASAGETLTFLNIMRFVGQGPGNDFTLQQQVHVTVNANGQTTTVVDNLRADCS
jgi:hypothetical protein